MPEADGNREVPRWRRSSAGLIILHLLIGIVAAGMFHSLVLGTVLSTSGRDPSAVVEAMWPGGPSIAILMGAAAWLLFVYLRRSVAVRAAWFTLFILVSLGVMLASTLSSPPVLSMDDFEGGTGIFSQDSDRFVDLSYVDGEYRVLIRDGDFPQIMRSFLDRAQPAVRIEASVRFSSGAHEQAGAGIGCWGGPAAYQLVLTPSGEALLLEVVSEETGERRPLTGATRTRAAPHEGPVRLRLDCVAGGRGETAVVGWVGGERIGAVGVREGLDGWNAPGFVVYPAEEGTEVRFDDYSVRGDTGQHKELAPPLHVTQFQQG